jgi:hypothetical protein
VNAPRTAPGFRLDNVSIGLRNPDHNGKSALAEASVEIGAFRIRAFLNGNGQVSLPTSLHDEKLRIEIAAAFRVAAVAALQDLWTRLSDREAHAMASRKGGAR